MFDSPDAMTFAWCEGWRSACAKVRDAITELQQKNMDEESHKLFAELFEKVRAMDKSAMNEVPTITQRKC